MLRPRHFIAFFSLLFAGSASAQTAFDSGYDCWIGNDAGLYTTHIIRCIADRDHLAGTSPDGEFMLDQIHSLLHQSAVGEVERIVQADPELLKSGQVRSVVLFSYPAEWSWQEALPQKLVNSAWCASTDDCRVSFFKR